MIGSLGPDRPQTQSETPVLSGPHYFHLLPQEHGNEGESFSGKFVSSAHNNYTYLLTLSLKSSPKLGNNRTVKKKDELHAIHGLINKVFRFPDH